MPWLRVDDSALTHPKLFELLEACDGDHALRNEAWGFLVLASSVSAQHLTDYVVSTGLLATIAPGRHQYMIKLLTRAGLMKPVEHDGRKQNMIVTDEQLLHVRKKAAVEIDRARKRDSRNPDITLAARVRDGDVCRWCGQTVKFADHKSNKGGTIDSLNGHEDSTVDTVVVACRKCNSIRKEQNPETKFWKLRPAPEPGEAYYDPSTIEHINGHSWAKANGIKLTPRQTELSFKDLTPESEQHNSDRKDTSSDNQASAFPSPVAVPQSDKQEAPIEDSDPVADATRLRREFREEQRRQREPSAHVDHRQSEHTTVPDDQAPAWLYASSEELFGSRGSRIRSNDAYITGESQPKNHTPSGLITGRSRQDHISIKSNAKSSRGFGHEGDVQEMSGTGRDGSGLVGTGRNGTGRSGPGRLWSGLASSLRSLKGSGRKD